MKQPNATQIALLEARRCASFPKTLTGVEKVLYERIGQTDGSRDMLDSVVSELTEELETLHAATLNMLQKHKQIAA